MKNIHYLKRTCYYSLFLIIHYFLLLIMFCDDNYIELDMTIVSEIIKKDLDNIITKINNDLKIYKLHNHSIKKQVFNNNVLSKDYKNNYDYDNILFNKDEKYMLINFYNKKSFTKRYNKCIFIAFNKNKIPNEYLLEYYNLLKKCYAITFLFLIMIIFLTLFNETLINGIIFNEMSFMFIDIIILILVFLLLFLIVSPIIITEIIINNKINKILYLKEQAKRQKYYNIIGKNMDILDNKINIYYKYSNKKNEIYSLKL